MAGMGVYYDSADIVFWLDMLLFFCIYFE